MNFSCTNQEACPVILDSKCVIYEGENLLYIGVNTNDNFRTALQNINTVIGNLILTGGITELIGDVTAMGPGIATATLATVNNTPGQYGSSTAIPKLTVDGKGRVTAITTDPVFIPSGALHFIGDVTGNGNTGSDTTLTLATVNNNVFISNSFLKFAVNAKGLITSASPVNFSDINAALGYTPYSTTNPANYISRLGLSASGPLAYDNISGNFSIQLADATHAGYLSATDWNTFNNKQTAGNYITDLTGEASASGPGVANITLNNNAVTGKVLTGVNITGGSISDTDSILTAFGKVQNQINALIGGSIYQGNWNAATNTPTLTSGVGVRGHYYIVNVPGSTNLDGITDWELGDWAIFDGTAWQQVDNTDAVISVNGQTGIVSLTTDNIPEGALNQYYTAARARLALSAGAGISYDNITGVISSTITQYTDTMARAAISGGTGISYNNITGVITNTITQYTDALARQAISLTTTGSSGAATYNNITGVLNIPNYTSALTGYVPYTGATSDVNLGTYGLISDYLQLNNLPTSVPTTAGTMSWNDSYGTLDIKLKRGNVTLQVGQETVVPVINKTGINLLEANYQVVRVRSAAEGGAQGQRLAVKLALADVDSNSATTLGVVTETINDNQEGFITVFGNVNDINTTGSLQGETWADGDMLFLSPTVPGALTNIKPTAPQHLVIIGYVVYAHAQHGIIFTKVDNGYELEELHNVYAPDASKVNNQVLTWDAGTSLWTNKSIATILGYTPVPTTRTLTINGTAYDLSADRSWTISAGVSGSGTTNYISKWASSSSLGNSSIYDSGTAITVGATNGVRAFNIYSATADNHLAIYGTAPSVSMSDLPSGASYQAKFGLATSANQFAPGAVAGDFVIISQTAGILFNTNANTLALKLAGTGAATFANSVTAGSFVKSGGTASQILAADGSVITAGTGISISGGTISSTVTGGVTSFNTRTGAITLTLTDVTGALGYTPYNSTNPSGYITSSALSSYLPLSGGTVTGNLYVSNGSSFISNGYNNNGGFAMNNAGQWWGLVWNYGTNDWRLGYGSVTQQVGWNLRWDSSGNVWTNTSMRAPIFYDSDDTGYYLDLNSTSNSAMRIRGGTLYGPNTSWGAYLYVGTNGRPGSEACVAATNGNLHMDSANGYAMYLNYYSGQIVYCNASFLATGDITAYGSISDIRKKDNIEIISNAIEKVKKLDGITFNYKDTPEKRMTGVIAQQLLEVLPEVVYEEKGMTSPNSKGEPETFYAVRNANIVGLLIEAIKEQQGQIEELKIIINDLTK